MTFPRLWWLALVALPTVAPFVGEEGSTLQALTILLLLPIAVLAAVVGRRLGLLAVLGAAATIVVLVGAITLIAQSELRTSTLPECEGLMSGIPRNPCFHSAPEQATSGLPLAILVLVFGLPPGFAKVSADAATTKRRVYVVGRVCLVAVVVSASSLAWLGEAALVAPLGVALVASLALGALAGPKSVLTAALAVLLAVGVISMVTRGDRRDESLPSCPTLWEREAFGDRVCEESLPGQAFRGALPGLLVVVAGMTTVLLRFVADHGADPKGERPSSPR